MSGRIILFGATGYTGELTAHALADAAAAAAAAAATGTTSQSAPTIVLAGRNESRVRTLAEGLGFDWGVADVSEPDSIRALLDRGDVLISSPGRRVHPRRVKMGDDLGVVR